MKIQTAEEFKGYAESDDDAEFSKAQWEASDKRVVFSFGKIPRAFAECGF
ncbi:hypothetical protein J2785_000446 [Burkholderia ambifaria]|nr:hypothetical protein [Burkholderia ambifaria]MDR6497304.1 hypothetical protein [Burkholderia ambifaria]